MATFTTVKTGNWSDASVWDQGTVPNVDDDVIIKHDVTIDASIDRWPDSGILVEADAVLAVDNGAALNLWMSATIDVLGTLRINDGSFGIYDDAVAFVSGAFVTMSTAIGVTIGSNAILILDGPTHMLIGGTFTVQNGATLLLQRGAILSSVPTIGMAGNLHITGGSKLRIGDGGIQLDGSARILFDRREGGLQEQATNEELILFDKMYGFARHLLWR